MARVAAYPLDRIAKIAASADVSQKSVRRYLSGASMLGSTIRRIERAAALEGLTDAVERRATARGETVEQKAA